MSQIKNVFTTLYKLFRSKFNPGQVVADSWNKTHCAHKSPLVFCQNKKMMGNCAYVIAYVTAGDFLVRYLLPHSLLLFFTSAIVFKLTMCIFDLAAILFFTSYKKESHTLRKTTQIERRNIEIETFRYFDNMNVENS